MYRNLQMIIQNVELETVCGITSKLPQHDILEIAFWGRSNVGKSSLLNTLWGRKSLARTSSEPGKTQTINYYHVNNDLYMVDLPGYGYAKTSRSTTQQWMAMIRKYLETSRALRVVFLLIDSRHDPTEKDIEQFRLLYSLGFNPLIIATKVDKLKKNEKQKNINSIKRILSVEIASDSQNESSIVGEGIDLPVIPFSAATGEGKDEISEYIDHFIENISIE